MGDGVRDQYRMAALGDVLRQLLTDSDVYVVLEEDRLIIDGVINLTPYYEKIVRDEVRKR